MALGTKEDGHFAEEVVEGKEEELIIFKGLYSPNFVCAKFASLDKNVAKPRSRRPKYIKFIFLYNPNML